MTARRTFLELGLFAAAALAGVISIGQAFRGTPAWLMITAGSTWVLVRQMERVEDRWPRRPRPRAIRPSGHGPPDAARLEESP